MGLDPVPRGAMCDVRCASQNLVLGEKLRSTTATSHPSPLLVVAFNWDLFSLGSPSHLLELYIVDDQNSTIVDC
jgi:hypothetical protein